MPTTDSPPREQRHRALVDAARSLAAAHGARGFTVDRVAEVAGVSRRTVFNHFAGIDQLMVAVCEQVLAEVTTSLLDEVDRLTPEPPTATDARAALDALSEATRGVDLPSAIVTIHRVLGAPGRGDERAEGIASTAFAHVGGRLRARLLERAPGLDPLDLELSLALLTSGLALLAGHWLDQHPDLDAVTADARADWEHLLDRLLRRLRTTDDL